MTVAAFEAMLEAQGGRCLLCGEVPAPQASGHSPFHVDHDKRTGVVRGILCQSCNVILGMVDDSPEKLARIADAALVYLGVRT